MSDAVRTLARGDRFDRYEVLAPIASGGMASVYLGQSYGAAGFRRYVAIKRMHPHIAADPRLVDMFLDEANIAARIRHPNVVSTLDFGESPLGLYLVLDLVEGPSLLYLLRECLSAGATVPIPVALRVVLDMLEGLGAAHGLTNERGEPLGIVHRDVSPHNVLVGADGIARVTDFGIAYATNRLSETRVGEVKGKFSYIAPEQAVGGAVDARADLFAVGIVLWELLAGRKLFSGDNQYAITLQVMSASVPDVREFRPEVPHVMAMVVQRMLERSLEHRCASAGEVSDALADAGAAAAPTRTVAAFVERFGASFLGPIRAAMVESSDRSSPASARSVLNSHVTGDPGSDVGGTPGREPSGPRRAPTSLPLVEAETSLRSRPLPPPATLPSWDAPAAPALAPAQALAYTEAFGFADLPFRDVREADRFWYAGPFAEASDALLEAARSATSPIVLVGVRGSGRTFLLETQARRVRAARAVLVNPEFMVEQSLTHAAAIDLGVSLEPSLSHAAAFDALLRLVRHSDAELAMLFFCIDGLPLDLGPFLAEFRAILRAAPPWVRFVLSTEPERADDVRALCPRAVAVRPLTADETNAYVLHSLTRVATRGLPTFAPAVMPFLHARSAGAVRVVGLFTHNALQMATSQGSSTVTVEAARLGMKSKVPLSPADAVALLAREGR